MVTDEEYRALKTRVSNLEEKLNRLSQQYSSLLMKKDIRDISDITREGQKKHKDITKYEFEGKALCKRMLVLCCVKKYVQENNITSYERLVEVFPDYVQGSLGIVKKADDAERYVNASKRFFFADKDIIELEDGLYVVCSQWEEKNIKRFVKLVQDLGYEINVVERKYLA